MIIGNPQGAPSTSITIQYYASELCAPPMLSASKVVFDACLNIANDTKSGNVAYSTWTGVYAPPM